MELSLNDIISSSQDILGGKPVFTGTRVPVESLFLHLEKGVPLYEFLKDFPSVKREQAVAVLELASKLFTSGNLDKLHETAA